MADIKRNILSKLETNKKDIELVERLNDSVKKVKTELGKVIIGQEDIIDQLLISLLAKGHCLLVGVPGLAKTLLIKTLAQVLDLKFSRIQFTPDLMPSDITGTELVEEDPITKKRNFRFIPGPIFANVILADEINRTPPKTQAALLEAMQEHKVTTAGVTSTLQEPFFVLATQNPIEQEGTYPLPEAQLDRFMFNIWVDYPTYSEELAIVKATTTDLNVQVNNVMSGEEIVFFQNLIRKLPVADNVLEYAVKLASSTRPGNENSPAMVTNYLSWGAGPRASQYLIVGAKCHAALNGKYSPDIEDVKAVAAPILRHRIVRNYKAEADGYSIEKIIQELL